MDATAPVSTLAPEWIASFVDHGLYLRGWSLRTYRQGLATLATTPLTKTGLALWVRAQRERGLNPRRHQYVCAIGQQLPDVGAGGRVAAGAVADSAVAGPAEANHGDL